MVKHRCGGDGGFASRDNLAKAKACGVRDMAFHKSRPQDRGHRPKQWVYRKLRNFRAGIEAGMSYLKRLWLGALHLARH